jgi:hypothetical protein
VTVPPGSSESETTGGTASSLLPLGKHRRHRGNNIANTDSNKGPSTTPQTGPVTTGVEPSTNLCDTDGDGANDPGTTCTTGATGATGATGVDQSAPAPATIYSAPRKKHRAPSRSKSKSTSKSKSSGGSKSTGKSKSSGGSAKKNSAPKKRAKPKASV